MQAFARNANISLISGGSASGLAPWFVRSSVAVAFLEVVAPAGEPPGRNHSRSETDTARMQQWPGGSYEWSRCAPGAGSLLPRA